MIENFNVHHRVRLRLHCSSMAEFGAFCGKRNAKITKAPRKKKLMQTIILRHKAKVGVTPLGIVILHDTNEPILMAKTPLSRTLLTCYCKGVSLKLYDNTSRKIRDHVVKSKDPASFMSIGARYFEKANMTLEFRPYSGEMQIAVDGINYELKEVDYD